MKSSVRDYYLRLFEKRWKENYIFVPPLDKMNIQLREQLKPLVQTLFLDMASDFEEMDCWPSDNEE